MPRWRVYETVHETRKYFVDAESFEGVFDALQLAQENGDDGSFVEADGSRVQALELDENGGDDGELREVCE